MDFIEQSELSTAEKKQLLELWNREYPENLTHASLVDFEEYLEKLQESFHILIIDEQQKINGWYFGFLRNQERWFAIILDSRLQGHGLGTKLLNKAKENEKELNAWVIDHDNERKKNGDTYHSPLPFYLKNGFEIVDERLELDKISAVKIRWRKK